MSITYVHRFSETEGNEKLDTAKHFHLINLGGCGVDMDQFCFKSHNTWFFLIDPLSHSGVGYEGQPARL